jgi:PAS domain S-box-containing protein
MNILVIDDSAADRLLVERELRQGFSDLNVEPVRDTESFEQALEAGQFDLVITDYALRWSNGLKVLQQVKCRYPECPVIMFTGTGTQEVAVEGLKQGLDDYLIKSPKYFIRLVPAVRLALQRAEDRQQRALAEMRLQSLLNHLEIGVFRILPDGQLIEANPAFLQLLGVQSLQAVEPSQFKGLFSDIQLLRLDQRLKREIQLRNVQGENLWLRVSETLTSINGQLVSDGLVEDITSLKEAEVLRTVELEQLVHDRTQQLEEANKDLETYAYSISHELQESLRGIQGFAQILQEDHGDQLKEAGRRWLDRISHSAEQMEAIVQGLLIYNRLNQFNLNLQPLNLDSVIHDALEALELQTQYLGARVVVEKPLLSVVGHYPEMVQAVTNLLSNALKFVAPGVQPQVRLWTEQRQHQVRVWVEDNGIGIAPEDQERIFTVFERLHAEETYPGSGIGLAIVRRVAERMHGQAGVESTLEQGSRFWIELPMAS